LIETFIKFLGRRDAGRCAKCDGFVMIVRALSAGDFGTLDAGEQKKSEQKRVGSSSLLLPSGRNGMCRSVLLNGQPKSALMRANTLRNISGVSTPVLVL
jgi:hypothetical protein